MVMEKVCLQAYTACITSQLSTQTTRIWDLMSDPSDQRIWLPDIFVPTLFLEIIGVCVWGEYLLIYNSQWIV